MTMSQQDSAQLTYQVFAARRPGLNPDVPSGFEHLMWVENSATLITGERDAVLVDTFLTIEQSEHLADLIAASGKNLTLIYITHGHGDHYFSISTLKGHFPNARAVATGKVVDLIHSRMDHDLEMFSKVGPLPSDPGAPEPLPGGSLDLEGHPLVPIETGYTDIFDSTSLHVPSTGLLVAGDAVYSGIHPYLAETTVQSRLQWIDALYNLESIGARTVVAGHKAPDNDDDPRHIIETRRYLQDFVRLDAGTTSARELFDAMIELHPERANPGSLLGGCVVAKRQAAGS
jgi:glyoxylase-like metal-dependent hydrolase (beta-lactamase superfamily II)